MTTFLTPNQVVALHDRTLTEQGGEAGVKDLGLLVSALARPAASFEGFEVYPRLETKASALFCSLVKNSPFADGNKRVAALSLTTFLALNGWKLQAKHGELYALTLAVATGRATEEIVATWVITRKAA